jgi:Toprim-like
MTITPQTTRSGKVIHLLSLHDLGEVAERGSLGGRLRAYCPIHGGDHQRSLSIDPDTGWGFCHCCHATVRLRSTDATPSLFVGRRHDEHGRNAHTTRIIPFPGTTLSMRTRVATLPHWQQEEVAALSAIAPQMREALWTSRRAQAYLHARAIPLPLAQATHAGYLSRAVWERALLPPAQQMLLRRWIGRIVFPLASPDGPGFIGRALHGWEPGMDEDAHKALLDQPGAPRRWIKTNPAGWFGFDAPQRLARQLVLVEGGFDRLALLAAGFPASAIVALVGTAARPAWLARLAPQARGVVLALDGDEGGHAATAHLADEFRRADYTVALCPPPRDGWGKDWSERFRRLGPQGAWPLYETLAHLEERT